jgi:hypothetical protein
MGAGSQIRNKQISTGNLLVASNQKLFCVTNVHKFLLVAYSYIKSNLFQSLGVTWNSSVSH